MKRISYFIAGAAAAALLFLPQQVSAAKEDQHSLQQPQQKLEKVEKVQKANRVVEEKGRQTKNSNKTVKNIPHQKEKTTPAVPIRNQKEKASKRAVPSHRPVKAVKKAPQKTKTLPPTPAASRKPERNKGDFKKAVQPVKPVQQKEKDMKPAVTRPSGKEKVHVENEVRPVSAVKKESRKTAKAAGHKDSRKHLEKLPSNPLKPLSKIPVNPSSKLILPGAPPSSGHTGNSGDSGGQASTLFTLKAYIMDSDRMTGSSAKLLGASNREFLKSQWVNAPPSQPPETLFQIFYK
ncbi:hypothetical protein [Fictibacillus terranigra]|uniref:Uncharacterized protein n=1 Tax=Fictibacillus terranigra TaxID=3058424 RepID=A0ABT8EBB5_9BACL|nr:hypothetical protein [Fictibacillus sp. CENA-BCM004]MDN4075206.1 hypothetical protein [Fictibacillus sp. CENA-BCM004]